MLLSLLLLAAGCTEQYALQTTSFEDALVVEATITNELKKQQIRITRTYKLEENGPQPESRAVVYITDESGKQYDFEENDGIYLSADAFAAETGKLYQLHISTQNGKSYTSSTETLTTVNNMQDVKASVKTVKGDRGVSINAMSFDPANSSKYYRYEFEETYKVIAPKWDDERAVLGAFDPGTGFSGVSVIPRTIQNQVCYSTKKSEDIIQTSTNDLSEDRVDFPVRFISTQNYIISYRYSILVWQYVQNLAAYTFYKTLKNLSGSESILSSNQPGFFYGNLKSEDDPNERIVGFFEVSSVSSKRIYFNYEDLFPGEPLPPYFTECDVREFKYCFNQNVDPECKGAALVSVVGSNSLVHYDSNISYFFMVPPPCGDCTSFSSNIKPAFWID